MNKSSVLSYSVIYEEAPEGGYVVYAPALPGCHTQARTIDELLKRTKEAISLYLKSTKDNEIYSNFLGVQQIEV